jgi:hypothetical protein
MMSGGMMMGKGNGGYDDYEKDKGYETEDVSALR